MTIHKNRRNPIISKITRFCKNIYRASWHPGYNVSTNGEKNCLEICLKFFSQISPLVFDVGANIGDWTEMCHKMFPEARIESFELSPRTALVLKQRLSVFKNIHINPFGLYSHGGEVDFFCYEEDASVLSGLRAPIHSHVAHVIKKTKVVSGDDFCGESKISRVNYLKIDAEGADYDVLLGFKRMLLERRVDVIQFEHEGGRYIRDFYDLLGPMGYRIGKLYSNYVDFCDHNSELEHDLGPNYLAVRKEHESLVSKLLRGW